MNYQELLDKELNNIKKMDKVPTLLLHACCAPCSSYVIEYLSNYFKITMYYYNPNIYPKEEYEKRLNELKRFIKQIKTKYSIDILDCKYDSNEYFSAIKGLEDLGERSERCYKCYEIRIRNTASIASKYNFDYFTTTLSISPYKNCEWINKIGIDFGVKYNVKYLFNDFKKRNGYKRSIELSKEYNLYRQDYCGCIYSKLERESEKREKETI